MKCELCKAQIQETFLKKIVGTFVKDQKGKKHVLCPACQQKNPRKEELISRF